MKVLFLKFVPVKSFLIVILFLIIVSCKKEAVVDNISEGDTLLDIKISNAGFEDAGIIGNKAANNATAVMGGYTLVDTFINNFVPDLGLSASVTVEEPTKGYISSLPEVINPYAVNKATTGATVALLDNAWYKVIIFDDQQKFFQQVDYQHKRESEQLEKIVLKQSKTYTVIVYSVNSTTKADLPAYNGGTEENPKLISESSIDVVGNKELLFRKIALPSSNLATQTLNIVLQQQFSNVKVTLEASQAAGLSIKSSSTPALYLKTPVNIATKKFGDLSIVRSGVAFNTDLIFTLSNQNRTATSSYNVINKESGTTTLEIANLVLGTVGTDRTIGTSAVPVIALSGLSFDPGKQYNIILSITAADGRNPQTGDVTINGVTWAPYNLRETPRPYPQLSVSPHVAATYTPASSVTARAYGDYYQWGRNTPAIKAPVFNEVPALVDVHWQSAFNQATAWNKTSLLSDLLALNPQKGDFDPCPTNYRVPTNEEFGRLNNVNSTSITTLGNPAAAVTFTSKANNEAKVTIPLQGLYKYNGTTTENNVLRPPSVGPQNFHAYLWTSYYYYNGANYQIAYFVYSGSTGIPLISGSGVDNVFREFAKPIRCVRYQ